MVSYNDYMKSKTFESQINRMYGSNPVHNAHIDEFQQLAASMIDQALREHDEKLQIDVQTTLNGRACSMPGLVSDIKKQIVEKLRKAFR